MRPAAGRSRSSAYPSRPRRRRRGARSCGSPPGPSVAPPWPGGSLVAALAPLVLARGDRFRWAGRFWSIALVVLGGGLDHRTGVDRKPGHRPPDPAGPGRGGHRRRHRPRRGRLRGGPPGRRVRMATAGHRGRHRAGRPRRPPDRRSRPCPGRWDLPVNDFSQSVAWMQAKAADRGVPGALARATPHASTRAPGRPAAAWPTPPPRTVAPTPAGCGTPPAPGPAVRAGLRRRPGPRRGHRPARPPAGPGRGPLRGPADLAGPRDRRRAEPHRVSGPRRCWPRRWPDSSDLSPVLSGTGITVYANSRLAPPAGPGTDGHPPPRTAEPNPLAGSPGSGIVPWRRAGPSRRRRPPVVPRAPDPQAPCSPPRHRPVAGP